MAARKKELQVLHDKVTAATALVTDLMKQIPAATADITADEDRFEAIVEALNDGAVGGDPKHHEAAEELFAAIEKKKIARTILERRLAKAQEQKASAEATRNAAENAAQIERVKGFIGTPDIAGSLLAYAAQVERGIAMAVAGMHGMDEVARKKIIPGFVGQIPATGAGLLRSELVDKIANEIARVGYKPIILGVPGAVQPLSFPGWKIPDHRTAGQPEKIPSLVETYTAFGKYLSGLMLGTQRWDGKAAPASTTSEPITGNLPTASADDVAAGILGDEPKAPPALKVSDSAAARAEAEWLKKQGISSSVADGELAPPEEMKW